MVYEDALIPLADFLVLLFISYNHRKERVDSIQSPAAAGRRRSTVLRRRWRPPPARWAAPLALPASLLPSSLPTLWSGCLVADDRRLGEEGGIRLWPRAR